jgi:hypothetical protein
VALKVVSAVVFLALVTSQAQAVVISALERLDGGVVPQLHRGEDIFTFFPHSPVWRDYTFMFDETPTYLRRADHVLTSYFVDKSDPDFQLKLTLATAAQIYVLVDNRVSNVPGQMPWLETLGFADTGDDVTIRVSADMVLTTMSIYSGRFPAGNLTLLQQNDFPAESGMYTIAAAAVPEPSSAVLLVVACGALTLICRRRRKLS